MHKVELSYLIVNRQRIDMQLEVRAIYKPNYIRTFETFNEKSGYYLDMPQLCNSVFLVINSISHFYQKPEMNRNEVLEKRAIREFSLHTGKF